MLDSVLGDLDELKDIMSKNIDNVAMRGERLELLVNKTENLSTNVSKIYKIVKDTIKDVQKKNNVFVYF